jgi:phosphoribosyl 1,2-cyclic phosphodiesterase
MMKICALYSGSSGNSIFISNKDRNFVSYNILSGVELKNGTNILVDAGMNGKQMQIAMNAIGESMDEVHGILITHEHIDHMRGIGVIMRRHGIPIYVNAKTWQRMQNMQIGDIPDKLVNIIKSGKTFEIRDLVIESFRTPHDAIESVGYRIIGSQKSVSVFTDIGEVQEEMFESVAGSDAIFIESNYDTKMLWEGSYPYMLKKRIDSSKGHLSNEDCAKTIVRLLERGTTKFVLSHLSQENNLPSVALKTTTDSLLNVGARIGSDLEVIVAKRSCVSTPWIL